MVLIYPAVFTPFLPEEGEGYTVEVPDLPGCVTEGDSLYSAILMAQDAASGWVLTELEAGRPAPSPSSPSGVSVEPGSFVSLLTLDMDAYAEKYGSKAVRKNVTIPAWLNTFGENRGLNFSKVLSDALQQLYAE